MPAIIRETWNSRKIKVERGNASGPAVDFEYFIAAEPSETAAYSLLATTAPGNYLGLARTSLNIDPLGGGCWTGAVSYAIPEGAELPGQGTLSPPPPPPPAPGQLDAIDPGVSISFGTEQIRVKQAQNTVANHVPAGGAPVNFRGVIGQGADGKIEGIDVPAPKGELRLTRVFPFITWKYLMDLWDVIGCTNDNQWGVFKHRELLYLGGEFQARQIDQATGGGWSGTFNFGFSKEKLNIAIDEITVAKKRGWEYLDVKYATKQDPVTQALIEAPIQVDVLQIFPDADFLKLRIWA
jgi:hypothetical protein